MSKHLPVEPSPEWFRENIHAIAHRLKKETTASAAFCSLPPIGEDPTSAAAFQSEPNRRVEEYSETISDGVHLNRRGGIIAADLIQQFIG